MGTLSTGVGLISGLDHTQIISQLMALESQPRDRLMTRMSGIDAQKTAYMDISARLSALLSRISVLKMVGSFQSSAATSSKPDVLTATSSLGTPTGTYQFAVRALAATHQLVSRGFDSRTATLTAGTVTIESAQARVDRQTRLEQLNGGAGVQRGNFKLINAAGQQATVNITDAVTLDDVVDRINAAGLNVRAAVTSDGLTLTDASTGSGHLQVQELAGGHTAAGLGFGVGRTSDADGDKVLAGSALMYLTANSPLSALNDGLGLRHAVAGSDLSLQIGDTKVGVDLSEIVRPDTRLARLNHGAGVQLGRVEITAKDGAKVEVDLSGAQTIGDVQQQLQAAFGGGRISVTLTGNHLLVSDNTALTTGQTAYTFALRDVTGTTIRDLGLDATSADGRVTGRGVLQMSTVGDVLAAINYAAGNENAQKQPLVQAELASDGRGLVIRNVNGGGPVTVDGAAGTLADLGLAAGTYPDIGGGAVVTGARVIGSLNTVLLKTLNGGAGFKLGTIHVAAGDSGVDVDLGGATTLTEVVERINRAAETAQVNVTVGYDPTGVRLLLANRDGGNDTLTVTDVSGSFAATAGLTQSGTTVRSANLQRRYVGETTLLSTLSNGRGVNLGTIKVTNSMGVFKTLTFDANSTKSLRDVIGGINGLGIGVTASINATGDGLLLTDTANGAGAMKVEDQSGTSARDLNIAATAKSGQLDGSFEFKFDVTGSDTLEGLATRISSGTTLAQATLLNDGTSVAPFRLNIAAQMSGARGELVLDDGGTDLGVVTLATAQDARILFGGSTGGGVLLSSAENTFTGVVNGLDVTVNDVSDAPVTVKVDRKYTEAVDAIKGLVSDYNAALSRIREVSRYDQDTQKKGILLGDSTITTSEYRLYRMFNQSFAAAGATVTRLGQIGLTSDGNSELTFNEDKFRQAYEANPEGVTKFFTDATNGVAAVMKANIERITGSSGLISSRTDTLDKTKELLQERVDRMNALLDRKKTRLQQQFQAMETALAGLQSQQQALAGFAASSSTTSSSSSSSSG